MQQTSSFGKKESQDVLLGGEYFGKSYLFDPLCTFTTEYPDQLLSIAKEIPGWLISCGGESYSRTFWVYAFYRGHLQRLYWNCEASVSKPLRLGTPLPSEAEYPIEEFQGSGLYAMLATLGFEYDAWYHDSSQPHVQVAYAQEVSLEGPLSSQIQQHHKQYAVKRENPLSGLDLLSVLQAHDEQGNLVYESRFHAQPEGKPSPSKKGTLRRMWDWMFE